MIKIKAITRITAAMQLEEMLPYSSAETFPGPIPEPDPLTMTVVIIRQCELELQPLSKGQRNDIQIFCVCYHPYRMVSAIVMC